MKETASKAIDFAKERPVITGLGILATIAAIGYGISRVFGGKKSP